MSENHALQAQSVRHLSVPVGIVSMSPIKPMGSGVQMHWSVKMVTVVFELLCNDQDPVENPLQYIIVQMEEMVHSAEIIMSVKMVISAIIEGIDLDYVR